MVFKFAVVEWSEKRRKEGKNETHIDREGKEQTKQYRVLRSGPENEL